MAMEQNSQMYYFVYNTHGDVISVTDSSGNAVATYTYDEFGNLKSSTGNIYNPLRYAAGYNAYYDEETNLYKIGVRYYSPEIGRWTSTDKDDGDYTSPQTQNKYVYCENNPISQVDPTGFSTESAWRQIELAGENAWDGDQYFVELSNRLPYLRRYYAGSIYGALHISITKRLFDVGLLSPNKDNWWSYENGLIICDLAGNIGHWSSMKRFINGHVRKDNKQKDKSEGETLWWKAHNLSMNRWDDVLSQIDNDRLWNDMSWLSRQGATGLMNGANNHTWIIYQGQPISLHPWDAANSWVAWALLR